MFKSWSIIIWNEKVAQSLFVQRPWCKLKKTNKNLFLIIIKRTIFFESSLWVWRFTVLLQLNVLILRISQPPAPLHVWVFLQYTLINDNLYRQSIAPNSSTLIYVLEKLKHLGIFTRFEPRGEIVPAFGREKKNVDTNPTFEWTDNNACLWNPLKYY